MSFFLSSLLLLLPRSFSLSLFQFLSFSLSNNLEGRRKIGRRRRKERDSPHDLEPQPPRGIKHQVSDLAADGLGEGSHDEGPPSQRGAPPLEALLRRRGVDLDVPDALGVARVALWRGRGRRRSRGLVPSPAPPVRGRRGSCGRRGELGEEGARGLAGGSQRRLASERRRR